MKVRMLKRDEMAATGRGEEVERLVETAKNFQRELREGAPDADPGEAVEDG